MSSSGKQLKKLMRSIIQPTFNSSYFPPGSPFPSSGLALRSPWLQEARGTSEIQTRKVQIRFFSIITDIYAC